MTKSSRLQDYILLDYIREFESHLRYLVADGCFKILSGTTDNTVTFGEPVKVMKDRWKTAFGRHFGGSDLFPMTMGPILYQENSS